MQWTNTTSYQQKCDEYALFKYDTRVKHLECQLKEGGTMHLLTENATVHKAKRKTRQWKTPTSYTQQLHIHALSK